MKSLIIVVFEVSRAVRQKVLGIDENHMININKSKDEEVRGSCSKKGVEELGAHCSWFSVLRL